MESFQGNFRPSRVEIPIIAKIDDILTPSSEAGFISGLAYNYLPMLISEIFESIQGEGATIGVPSVFVRLYGCNYKCKWCDTPYAWKTGKPKEMTPREVAGEILKYKSLNIIFTGGEPLLQQRKVLMVMDLLSNATSNSYTFEIETNGAFPLNEKMIRAYSDELLINFSPKLTTSGNKVLAFSKPSKLINAIYKFVITDVKDLEEVEVFIGDYNIEPQQAYLMPEGKTRAAQVKKMPWVIEQALIKGYRFSPRLHVLAWNTKKGV